MIIEFDGRRAEISEDIIESLGHYIDNNEEPEYEIAVDCLDLDWSDAELEASYRYEMPDLCACNKEEFEENEPEVVAPAERDELSSGFEPVEKTFQAFLFELIDRKGMKDSDVYKRAELDRRHFSKIRKNEDYRPTKGTAVALSFALGLNLDETLDLIGRAGYYLSFSSKSDLIIRFCIERGIYDLLDVNALLYKYDQPLLGSQA